VLEGPVQTQGNAAEDEAQDEQPEEVVAQERQIRVLCVNMKRIRLLTVPIMRNIPASGHQTSLVQNNRPDLPGNGGNRFPWKKTEKLTENVRTRVQGGSVKVTTLQDETRHPPCSSFHPANSSISFCRQSQVDQSFDIHLHTTVAALYFPPSPL